MSIICCEIVDNNPLFYFRLDDGIEIIFSPESDGDRDNGWTSRLNMDKLELSMRNYGKGIGGLLQIIIPMTPDLKEQYTNAMAIYETHKNP